MTSLTRLGVAAAVAVTMLAPSLARAAAFSATLDREAVAPAESFLYQITLTTNGDDASDFRPPDFRGFEVQEARGPSRSTSVQMVFGSNQQTVQSTYTWTYQLVLRGSPKGPLNIGAAHVKVGGRDLTTNSVQVRIGAASPQPRTRPAGPSGTGLL